jgi:hypothetical protein
MFKAAGGSSTWLSSSASHRVVLTYTTFMQCSVYNFFTLRPSTSMKCGQEAVRAAFCTLARYVKVSLHGQKFHYRIHRALRIFFMRNVAEFVENLQLAAGDVALEMLGAIDRNQMIASAPDDQRW